MTAQPPLALAQGGTALQAMTNDEMRSLRSSLMRWTVSEPLPEGIAQKLPAAMAYVEASLKPATEAEVAGQMDQLFAQLPMPGDVAMKQWRRLLRSYPIDLVRLGVAEVIKTHRWETPPKLAQFCIIADAEMRKRNDWKRKLSVAAMKARMTKPAEPKKWEPLSEETKRQLEQLKANLRANPMPLHLDDQRSEDWKADEREDSLRRAGHEGEGQNVG